MPGREPSNFKATQEELLLIPKEKGYDLQLTNINWTVIASEIIIPLVDPAVGLFLLTNGQLGQVGLDLTELGGEALILTGLNVEVGLHFLVHCRLDKLVRLLNEVADVAVIKMPDLD
jgi:hypothetical protein